MNAVSRCLCLGAILLTCATNARPSAPDPGLLSLIPPHSDVVARVRPSQGREGLQANLVIITRVSWQDVDQFIAWSGADASRVISDLMIASLGRMSGNIISHSLLAKGHFDHTRIYQSLVRNGGVVRPYRGLEIAGIPRTTNESDNDNAGGRWLAILDDQVLLLGSEGMIREELDRYLDRTKPDPMLLKLVAQLDPDDASWSRIVLSGRTREIDALLSFLDPRLPRISSDGEALVFGLNIRRQVRLELRVLVSPGHAAEDVSYTLTRSFPGAAHGLSLGFLTSEQEMVSTDVVMSKRAYTRWLAERASLSARF